MINESVKPANEQLLTEGRLNQLLMYAMDEDNGEVIELISSHRALNSRNAKLVHENDELNAENVKLKELMEWAARIIDSGMGAGILRYDPIQFFIDYHTYLKALEELNHE